MHHTTSFAQYTKELAASRYEKLDALTERQLVVQYSSGSLFAFDRLVAAHLRFIVYSLRDYRIPTQVDIMDVIQEANFGFIRGLERFDVNRNCRVFTYCIYWIRYYVNRMLRERQEISGVFTDNVHGADLIDAPDLSILEEVREQASTDILLYGLSGLDPRETAILTLFFGLKPPYEAKTLQEIGSMLHMHVERVRQVKNAALEKLKKKHLASLL